MKLGFDFLTAFLFDNVNGPDQIFQLVFLIFELVIFAVSISKSNVEAMS